MSAIKHFFKFISATRRGLQTEFYKFTQFSTKFNENVMDLTLVYSQPFHKLS